MRIALPVMRCDRNCGECCGMAVCNEDEFARINAHIRQHRIEPRRQGITCPFYQAGHCAIYEVRPWVCRLFGHDPGLVCPRGYNVNLDPRKLKSLHEQYRREGDPAARCLHELVYSLEEMKALVLHEVDDLERDRMAAVL